MKKRQKDFVISTPISSPLVAIAERERAAATDFVASVLHPEARVSVYLYQPVDAPGLRPESPGALFDIGPLPRGGDTVDRRLLFQCAEAGRTGSFLQSAADCTQRVPQTTQIDDSASRSYRAFNGDAAAREAQIAVEEARHGFTSPRRDGPPVGAYIHHLALAPSVHGAETVATGRIPVLGTIFTVTRERRPASLHEYSNLVDYAIFIAEEALEIRATHLLGVSHLGAEFEGSAIESLLDDPASDLAVQLVVKLLFAHHWFFPYDAAAHALLRHALGSDGATAALYAAHGWIAPRRLHGPARDDRAVYAVVRGDLGTLVRHLAWYRIGKEFRPRPGALGDAIGRALNTALPLLVGTQATMPSFRSRMAARSPRAGDLYLAPNAAYTELDRDDSLLAPVLPYAGIHALLRTNPDLARFAPSFAVCGPGDTAGHTRTHLKPVRFIEGFDRGGAPRFSARMHDGVRDRSRWLCSYAIARLAAMAGAERHGARAAS
ncbi:MAG: hypothetical protein HY084_09910 [Gemmatimonadetes bacterium]|nr:hypothetical protein [Gemmatimonadota bacterium]